jgi:hypothetical protein
MAIKSFSIIEMLILVVICSLMCSLPIQCQQAEARDICRTIMAEIHADEAKELALMANHPAPWMDEFRLDFHRLAIFAGRQSEYCKQASHYLIAQSRETEELTRNGYSESNQRRIFDRFKVVAAKNGYQRPRVGPGHYSAGGIVRNLLSCWPTFVLIGILIVIMRAIHLARSVRFEIRSEIIALGEL